MKVKITWMINAMFNRYCKLNEKQRADPEFIAAVCKEIDKLFDIAKCNCYKRCQNMEEAQQVACQCQTSQKNPKKEI